MKSSEIRERTDDELKKLSADLRRELWKARFGNHSHQLDDTSRIRELRKDVARVETIIRERVNGAQPAGGSARADESEQE